MKRWFKIILILFILCFILANLLFGFPIITSYNNYITKKYLNSLKNFKYPNSEVLNSSKYFGILTACGNHCDCKIFVLVESNLNFYDFKSYLDKNLSLKFPFNSYGIFDIYTFYEKDFYILANNQKFKIEDKNNKILCNSEIDKEFYMEKWEYKELKRLVKNIKLRKNKKYYIITSFDQTFSGVSMYDWRCH